MKYDKNTSKKSFKPSHAKYFSEERWKINKEKRVAKQMKKESRDKEKRKK